MSEAVPSSYSDPSSLLYQLESILESDPLIDEVGFVHPSQFASMSDTSQANTTEMSFWSKDHKVGISTESIHPLYTAAKHAFMSSLHQYKMLIPLHSKKVDNISATSSPLTGLENELMKHSRALLLLSCDFGTAWNCRKEVVLNKQDIRLYLDELSLSSLVLSCSPKSERTWSHRRWVIKMIAGKCTNLEEILKNESDLANRIAEKSKMNYRAWNHRCWLVSYMPESQVIDELIKYRDWAGLHVADNSCFHYRTRLMSRTLEDSWYKQDLKATEICQLWKEEITWSEILIKRYIGREALWLYRRFLSVCWMKHFAGHSHTGGSGSGSGSGTHLDLFVENEIKLFRWCKRIPDNVFEDYQAQAMFAATYIIWLIKEMDEDEGVRSRRSVVVEKVGEEVEQVVNKVCPEKAFLLDLMLTKTKV
ncbi:hypothetical protein Lser_V15G36552 [Lactuca serriola]